MNRLVTDNLEKPIYSLCRKMIDSVQNFFYPHNCINCHTLLHHETNISIHKNTNLHLCGQCFSQIHFIEKPYCQKSGLPLAYDYGDNTIFGEELLNQKTYYDHVRACVAFNDLSRKIVHQFKYGDETHLAHFLSQRMHIAAMHFFNSCPDFLIPVPLNYTKLIKRRYNQSALLCNALSGYTGVECDNLSFYKKYNTPSQTGLTLKQRIDNVHNAFDFIEENRHRIKDKSIILVDDIMTTGATVSECARVLKKYGATKVNVLVFARVLDN